MASPTAQGLWELPATQPGAGLSSFPQVVGWLVWGLGRGARQRLAVGPTSVQPSRRCALPRTPRPTGCQGHPACWGMRQASARLPELQPPVLWLGPWAGETCSDSQRPQPGGKPHNGIRSHPAAGALARGPPHTVRAQGRIWWGHRMRLETGAWGSPGSDRAESPLSHPPALCLLSWPGQGHPAPGQPHLPTPHFRRMAEAQGLSAGEGRTQGLGGARAHGGQSWAV